MLNPSWANIAKLRRWYPLTLDCSSCKVDKPIDDYYMIKDRLRRQCKDCFNAQRRQQRASVRLRVHALRG
jgi:hypothetical protein